LKILQVVPYFPPAYAFGGPVRVVFDISKELVKRGHEVVVYTSDAKDLASRLSVEPVSYIDGIKVYYFRNILFSKLKLFLTPELVSKVKEEVKQVDVIHLHEYRTFQNIIVHHYAMKYKVPYVLQAHGSVPRFTYLKWLKMIYDVFFGYRLLRDASMVIALNQAEVKQYKGMGVPEEKIEIIPNGIDLLEYNNLPHKGCFRKKFDIGDHEKIVLSLGRIHRIKGVDILVEAFENIIRELDNIRLVIVGPDDGYLDKIKFLIETKNMRNNVLITGPLYGKDKLEAYVDANVYVLPSRYEIWGMTLFESIACGTPVILTDNCGASEYFKDKTGLVAKPNSYELCMMILKLLQDTKLIDVFRMNCGKIIEEFDISKIIQKFEGTYKEVVRQPLV